VTPGFTDTTDRNGRGTRIQALAQVTIRPWFALKTALASVFHLAGVGDWSLGQEGASTAMMTALDGGTAPQHLPIASP
jgi:hypothetical protein